MVTYLQPSYKDLKYLRNQDMQNKKERRENRLKSKSTRKADIVCISNTAHKQISCDDIFVQEPTGRGIGTRQP